MPPTITITLLHHTHQIAALNTIVTQHATDIVSLKARVSFLETENTNLKARVAMLEEYATQDADWSKQVTDMLHEIDWAALGIAFPGGGGTNPPKTAPTWPPI